VDRSELDGGYRIAWRYDGLPGKIRDKPVQVDHLLSEGLASCLKVLIGTLIVILANIFYLFKGFKGQTTLYEGWHKANTTFSPGSQEYTQ